ncbi:Ferrous iron transport protein B [Pseudobythopirellula maris]|uniref:Ferrous iron transport protein B n=1 Tax=Pseudobythopirellula maris TaxID=2527991 RepID=A0A5C5ZMH8_9BACT|nr:ferrous iron transport protein B [Pseudobythopirellula maris]TWT88662.1 Ferrous iron transport protein B [Pseudobythopirellula maris]
MSRAETDAEPNGPSGLPILQPGPPTGAQPMPSVALVGNPNAGKTSLFNRLTGIRAHTANFPGTTVEHRRGVAMVGDAVAPRSIELIDLPGLYSLDAVTPDEQAARAMLLGELPGEPAPEVVVVVVDATNLERNLVIAGETIELGRPTIVALNMSDLAEGLGLRLNLTELSERLGCPVAPVSARTGRGLGELRAALAALVEHREPPRIDPALAACSSCSACPVGSAERLSPRFEWASTVRQAAVENARVASHEWTDRLDRVLAHPVWGVGVFALVMLATFMLIFSFASTPMDLIDGLFGWAGDTVGPLLPEGLLRSLVVDGVIAGVGGVLIFLPQICLLFFTIALLEQSGYLARAAFVTDRWMQKVGLPGKAFVPMLSAHACAIPAIMATRVIEDRRDRLVTILIAPLMSCSARLPVYVMVVAMLFPDDPLKAALLFAGAYLLGITAALVMAFLFKRTILPGESKPLLIELPNYRTPSLVNAAILTLDRAWVFVKNAGTVILVISLVLWALATFPRTDRADLPGATQQRIAAFEAAGDQQGADALLQQAQLEHSFVGRIGQTVQPVFAPLGYDWKISVGVMTSFAAREVVVSTLSILYGLGEESEEGSLVGALQASRDDDGEPVFTTATCLSLLVFFVLAMQCLPTQAVTKRETGSWGWALLQLGYMTVLAYVAALVTYQTVSLFGA